MFDFRHSIKKVSILGCGWVGKALQEKLNHIYDVHCLSRDMQANDESQMYSCHVLLIAIPPRDNYLEVLRQTLTRVATSTQVILLSSISFYDGKPLVVDAESLVKICPNPEVILRLGGLMGYDRIAGKYTAGKVLTADSRTNYVHRDDVIGIIESIIKKGVKNEVFDVITPIQTTKKKIFSQNAQEFGFKKTDFLNDFKEGKVLYSTKVCKKLGYTFQKEDVHTFWSL